MVHLTSAYILMLQYFCKLTKSEYTPSIPPNYELIPTQPPDSFGAIPICGEDDQEYKLACVPYYNCNYQNNTITEVPIVDGSNKVKPRANEQINRKCNNFIDVCCGLPNTSNTSTVLPILNPKPTETEEWLNCGRYEEGTSWMVSILVNGKEVCEGSLITPRVVLTAAHCIRQYKSKDILIKLEEGFTVEVQHIFTHNYFINGSLYKDAGLILLKQPLTLKNSNKRTLCLQLSDTSINANQCYVLSNQNNLVQSKEIKVVSRRNCQRELQNSTLGNQFILDNAFICGNINNNEQEIVKIKGGCPLVCTSKTDPNQFIQIGISSWYIDSTKPDVFTDISKIRKWIDDKITLLGLSKVSYSTDIL